MNSNVICTTSAYNNLKAFVAVLAFTAAICPLVLFFCILFNSARHGGHHTVSGRTTLGLLTAGWRDPYFYFELIYIARTMVMSMIPIFATSREAIFHGYLGTLLVVTVISRVQMPRMN